ncbi:putative ABC transport system permease protein [Kribbella amoyensis]|uniref:Putative ABC transport system permease protein n=1 Tax=Kribbella amoyensis TaxID=996641 RepID=A0A561B2G4_9ACTN|nr:ABC transporter permease [Kribbella amoyensis]TWD73057.1 putative ABC transport system permease protein [Kribbella amoyensis]
MIRFALAGMLSRKLRTALTAIGVVLGVSLISGTYVLTDSITGAFDSIFSENYKNTDATVTGKTAFDTTTDNAGGVAPPFSAALLPEVRKLPEVGAADGTVAGEVQLIGRDGKAIVFGGAPNLGFSVNPELPQFNVLSLISGGWPGPREVVIDTKTAQEKGFAAGDEIGVQARGAAQKMRISGLVEFGAVSSIGGATLAGFELPTAQQLFGKVGQLDQILIAAKDGVSQQQLVDAVGQILPAGTQVRTAEQQAEADSADTSGFLDFFRNFLLVFGGIALFVGSFVIANSLSITIAQRTREFATLRTLGASRRQILSSVVLEALITGLLSAIVGLFLGLAIATGLFNLFDAVGFTLPNNGLVFQTRTIVVGLLVGVLVTVVASLRPAWRATRVPPIAAVREGAKPIPGRFHRYRPVGAALLAVAGIALVVVGLFVNGLSTATLLAALGAGVLLLFIGVALFSSRLVKPLAAASDPVARWAVVTLTVIVWPILALIWLVKRLFRRPAQLPRVLPDVPATTIGGQNSRRDPARTASTAAALMIGLALVTLVATLGAGIIKPFEDAVDGIFSADYAITAQNNFSPLSPDVAAAVAKTPGVEAVTSIRGGQAQAFGENIQITAVDANAPDLLTFDWRSGSQQTLGALGTNGAIVDAEYADKHSLTTGSQIAMTTVTGKVLQLKVLGVFKPPAGGSPFGNITLSTPTFDANNPQPLNIYTFVNMTGGVTAANTAALDQTLSTFPNAKALDRDAFKKAQTDGIKSILNVLYVLLALSVLVSLFGIVNTLVLTVFERTRELGMLRAVGLTRGQVKKMIRHESVITALIGAVIGIVLGLGLALLLAARLEEISFAVPAGQLIVFAVLAVVVGILAAIWPARRAARLNPLEALQYE